MQQSEYLALMQIDTWKRRVWPTISDRSLVDVYLYTFKNNCNLVAIAGVKAEEEAKLCGQIVAATKQSVQGGFVSSCDLQQQVRGSQCLLFFGEALAQEYCQQNLAKHTWHCVGDKKIRVTHSLAAMLQDPGLKRQVWADLQTFMRELHAA